MEKTPKVGWELRNILCFLALSESTISYLPQDSHGYLLPCLRICHPWSRKENFGRGDNEIDKSRTEIPGCGLDCLEISQTPSHSGFAVDSTQPKRVSYSAAKGQWKMTLIMFLSVREERGSRAPRKARRTCKPLYERIHSGG